jgi:endonuclease G
MNALRPVRFVPLLAALIALGACSEGASVATAPEPRSRGASAQDETPTLVITELMADPSAVLDEVGEYIEVFNPGASAVDMQGWRLISNGTENHTVASSFVVPPCGVAVLVRNGTAANGGITGGYVYGTNVTLNNNTTDFIVIKRADNSLVDSVSYSVRTAAGAVSTPTYTPSAGIARVLVDPAVDNTNVAGNSNWINTPAGSTYGAGDRGTPGVAGAAYAAACGATTTPPGAVTSVTVSPSPTSVTVGGTRTLGASAVDRNGSSTQTTFTWTSANDAIASVSSAGIVTGVGIGSVLITARSANGVTGSATVNVITAAAPAQVSLAINDPRSIPVGFTKPSFPTVRDTDNTILTGVPLAWTTSDPGIATVDGLGYITGVSAGTVTVRATATNGVSGTNSVTIVPASATTTAVYRNHREFGTPVDGTPADEQIIARTEYTSSWNSARGAPNWVSWNLNASQFGNADRCDCFSADPLTPDPRVVDFNYRNGGYDRGHMVQSESRTATFQENAATFLLTNIIPQAANNNQGPWLAFENYLNDLARTEGKEIYVVAGGEYGPNAPSLKGENRVFVPDYTWKVAVIRPAGAGLAGIGGNDNDVQVIAARFPNRIEPGIPASAATIRNAAWQTFQTTVDQIETLTGYDLLSSLPDGAEATLESGQHLPIARAGGPYQAPEGSALQFSGALSTDADPGPLSYSWSFGDRGTGSGISPTHTYADNGTYVVTLTVTDGTGGTSTSTVSAVITNVAPTTPALVATSLFPGEMYAASGTVTDVGSDIITATVDYGTGSGAVPLSMNGSGYSLSNLYAAPGSYTVTLRIRDDDGAETVRTAIVTVKTLVQGAEQLSDALLSLMRARVIGMGEGNALASALRDGANRLSTNGPGPLRSALHAFISRMETLPRSAMFTEQRAATLIATANRMLASLGRS